jgi:hypothetical protein
MAFFFAPASPGLFFNGTLEDRVFLLQSLVDQAARPHQAAQSGVDRHRERFREIPGSEQLASGNAPSFFSSEVTWAPSNSIDTQSV